MPAYKLTYFDFRGLGEPIRLLLSYGGQEFEDVRMEYGGEEWQKFKPNTPFGQLPLLEFDGKQIFQHVAVARYLAKQYKLAGDNDWEALQADIVVDTISDLKTKLYDALWGPDPEVVKKNYEEAVKTTVPFYLEKLNALATSGYLANGKLSWADLYFFAFIELLESFLKETTLNDKYANLAKVRDNVLALPKVKAWVDKRPKTEY